MQTHLWLLSSFITIISFPVIEAIYDYPEIKLSPIWLKREWQKSTILFWKEKWGWEVICLCNFSSIQFWNAIHIDANFLIFTAKQKRCHTGLYFSIYLFVCLNSSFLNLWKYVGRSNQSLSVIQIYMS